ncbi:MAG: transcriptional regulator [Rhodobacterales bacterium]|nr:MAG: transcriptional regulator [Rhodobacterales bacterium]
MTQAPDQDLMTRVRATAPGMAPKLRAIAEFSLRDTERFIRNTSREICAEIGSSEPTLVRFCRAFGYSGLSDFRIDLALSLARQPRAHGFVEPLPRDRRLANLDAKRRIAEHAVTLPGPHDTLLIDNGSSAEFFAAVLPPEPKRTIMTNGLVVAQNAMERGRHSVWLTGGRIRPQALSLTGRQVETALAEMRFGTVEEGLGFSTFREDEAHVTRTMVEAAARVIVLADRTRFRQSALHRICGFSEIDDLVTDLPPDHPALPGLRASGVRVETVSTAPRKPREDT